MNYNTNTKKISFIINIVYIILIIFVLYMVLKYALVLFLPFLAALLISYIAEPAISTLTNRLKIKRSISSAVCITFFVLILIGVTVLLSITVMSKLKELYNSIPEYIEQITYYFNGLKLKSNYDIISPFEQVTLMVFEHIKDIDIVTLLSGSFGSFAFNSFSGLVTSIPYVLMSLVITFVSAVFISISFCEIKRFIILQFSDKYRKLILESKRSLSGIFKKYVKSYAALMLITFSELTLFFIIFDIRPAASVALIIAVVDILPVLGVGTVMLPWAIICFVGGNLTKGLVLMSIYSVITVVRKIIEPKIIGENIGLHPIVTLISIYVGLKILGILGMFVAPILIMLIRDLQKKGLIHVWNEK